MYLQVFLCLTGNVKCASGLCELFGFHIPSHVYSACSCMTYLGVLQFTCLRNRRVKQIATHIPSSRELAFELCVEGPLICKYRRHCICAPLYMPHHEVMHHIILTPRFVHCKRMRNAVQQLDTYTYSICTKHVHNIVSRCDGVHYNPRFVSASART